MTCREAQTESSRKESSLELYVPNSKSGDVGKKIEKLGKIESRGKENLRELKKSTWNHPQNNHVPSLPFLIQNTKIDQSTLPAALDIKLSKCMSNLHQHPRSSTIASNFSCYYQSWYQSAYLYMKLAQPCEGNGCVRFVTESLFTGHGAVSSWQRAGHAIIRMSDI